MTPADDDGPMPTGQAFLDRYCDPELADPPLPRRDPAPRITHDRDLCGQVADEHGIPPHLVCPYHYRRYPMPRWIALLIGAVVCVVIAIALAPYIPAPGDAIVALVAWIGAAVCAILAVLQLVRGGAQL